MRPLENLSTSDILIIMSDRINICKTLLNTLGRAIMSNTDEYEQSEWALINILQDYLDEINTQIETIRMQIMFSSTETINPKQKIKYDMPKMRK